MWVMIRISLAFLRLWHPVAWRTWCHANLVTLQRGRFHRQPPLVIKELTRIKSKSQIACFAVRQQQPGDSWVRKSSEPVPFTGAKGLQGTVEARDVTIEAFDQKLSEMLDVALFGHFWICFEIEMPLNVTADLQFLWVFAIFYQFGSPIPNQLTAGDFGRQSSCPPMMRSEPIQEPTSLPSFTKVLPCTAMYCSETIYIYIYKCEPSARIDWF